jgi:arabinofuranan 3-O-arabinosyltransferase
VIDAPHDIVAAFRRFLCHRLTRLAVSWVLCLLIAATRWHHAYHCFDSPPTNDQSSAAERDKVREDKNNGHTWIDFGGQYVFGRTAAEGNWRHLYDRDVLRRTADAAYPIERQSPAVQKYHDKPDQRPSDLSVGDASSDADRLLRSMMGDEEEGRRNAKLAEVVGAAFAGGTDNPFAVAACTADANDRTEQDLKSEKPALGRKNLGGPLYPPVHSIFYYPLGLISNAQLAYHLFQLFSIVTVFGSGLAVHSLTRGRIWWPVATTLLLLMPGMRPGIDLGQNHAVTLLIVLSGWAIGSRYSQFGGGMVWGLLAFKPVWGLAFILAPLLLRKWKFVGGTATSGILICLATLPLVGIQGWIDWWEIGRSAADLYNVDENWINLSRDVSGIPKRLYLDFSKPRSEVGNPDVNRLGSLLQLGIGIVTLLVGTFGGETLPRMWQLTRTRGFGAAVGEFLSGRTTSYVGLRAGFLLLGGWLCCYRFMYYDSALIGVGLAALFAYPKWQTTGWRAELKVPNQPPAGRRTFAFVNSFPLTILVLLILTDNVLLYCGQEVTMQNEVRVPYPPDRERNFGLRATLKNDHIQKEVVDTTVTPPKTMWVKRELKIESGYNTPVETFLVFFLWVWCARRLIRHGDREMHPTPVAAS